MASWIKNREGQWIVIAKENEVAGSVVVVRKKSGETQTVNIGSKSRPFAGKYGEYAGQQCVFITPQRNGLSQTSPRRCLACEYNAADDMDDFEVSSRMERDYGRRVDYHTCR